MTREAIKMVIVNLFAHLLARGRWQTLHAKTYTCFLLGLRARLINKSHRKYAFRLVLWVEVQHSLSFLSFPPEQQGLTPKKKQFLPLLSHTLYIKLLLQSNYFHNHLLKICIFQVCDRLLCDKKVSFTPVINALFFHVWSFGLSL